MGAVRGLFRWLSFSGSLFLGHPPKRRVIHLKEHQAELAAVSGLGADDEWLPVRIELRSETDAPWGQYRMQCWIEGTLIGYMDPHNALRLMDKVLAGERSGQPMTLDGYIVRGWNPDYGREEGYYGVMFADEWDLPELDSDIEELLEVKDSPLSFHIVRRGIRPALSNVEVAVRPVQTTKDRADIEPETFPPRRAWSRLADQPLRSNAAT